jgi:D-alanyl-D-alanine carboxypeptidase (penicillin-binding protein 5/6)
LTVTLDDKVIVDQPLVALEDVPLGGFFKRLWDTLTLFFVGLFS